MKCYLPKDRGACLWRLSTEFQSWDLLRISYSNYFHWGYMPVDVKWGEKYHHSKILLHFKCNSRPSFGLNSSNFWSGIGGRMSVFCPKSNCMVNCWSHFKLKKEIRKCRSLWNLVTSGVQCELIRSFKGLCFEYFA